MKSIKNNPYFDYTLGFIFSLSLTLVPFYLIHNELISGQSAVIVLFAFAFTQAAIQLIYFLHLGSEKGIRWQLYTLLSTVLVLIILVVGSIWIINNLHYNTQTPQEREDYLLRDEKATKLEKR